MATSDDRPAPLDAPRADIPYYVPEQAAPKCPSVDWVHHNLMDDYLQISKDPQSKFKFETTAWGWDFYKLDLGTQQLGVGVGHGDDPRQATDVKALDVHVNEYDTVSDIYKDGQRFKATFEQSDPKSGERTANGLARFAQDGASVYITEMSGGIYPQDQQNSNTIRFDSKFDKSGHMTEFLTIKNGDSLYTPDVCDK